MERDADTKGKILDKKHVLSVSITSSYSSFVVTISFLLMRPSVPVIDTYTTRNSADLLQFFNLGGLMSTLKLQQTCQFHKVTTCVLKSGLLQLVICRLETNCSKLVEKTFSDQTDLTTVQHRQTYPQQAVASCASASWLVNADRFAANCALLAV